MAVSAVFWDVDGTLVDSELLHHEALLDALGQWKISPPPDLQAMLIGLSMTDTFSILDRQFPGKLDFATFVAAKFRAYVARSSAVRMRPGAADAYQLLARQSIPQALVSNSDRIIVEANVRAIGLFEPGLICVARNDVRRGKPDPEPYLRAAHLLNVPPSECLVIEDSPLGTIAGLAAGMQVIAWPEPERIALDFPVGVIAADPKELNATLMLILTVQSLEARTEALTDGSIPQ
jgi:HAD superfamily hydrolase (TIGR01509 family)